MPSSWAGHQKGCGRIQTWANASAGMLNSSQRFTQLSCGVEMYYGYSFKYGYKGEKP